MVILIWMHFEMLLPSQAGSIYNRLIINYEQAHEMCF
jgi:hypothetical protein